MVGESGENGAQQGGGPHEWHDIEYQGEMAEASPCSERALKTPLPQQSSSSAREEDGRQAKARYCLREIGKGNAEIRG